MIAIEALEAMKNGFAVVAFQPDTSLAREMFKMAAGQIELYLPDLSEWPADTLTTTQFLGAYVNAKFVGYNVNINIRTNRE